MAFEVSIITPHRRVRFSPPTSHLRFKPEHVYLTVIWEHLTEAAVGRGGEGQAFGLCTMKCGRVQKGGKERLEGSRKVGRGATVGLPAPPPQLVLWASSRAGPNVGLKLDPDPDHRVILLCIRAEARRRRGTLHDAVDDATEALAHPQAAGRCLIVGWSRNDGVLPVL